MNFNLPVLTEQPLETHTLRVCFWILEEERKQQFSANPHLGPDWAAGHQLLWYVASHCAQPQKYHSCVALMKQSSRKRRIKSLNNFSGEQVYLY